jgi:hypothetical protein
MSFVRATGRSTAARRSLRSAGYLSETGGAGVAGLIPCIDGGEKRILRLRPMDQFDPLLPGGSMELAGGQARKRRGRISGRD